jgi:molecular chaperone GrpE
MDDKNKNQEEIIQNPEGGEENVKSEPVEDGRVNETVSGIASDHPDHKKEKPQKSKHGKEDRTGELELEIAQWNDKYLRLYSEFDNYRKRSLRERIELSKSAASELILTLLPVLDDFERALDVMETKESKEQAILEGISLIYNKLKTILSLQGLERMKALGEEFDTDFHEALTNIPAPVPEQKGKVIEVIQNGYLLNGKVLRYAKVVVGN